MPIDISRVQLTEIRTPRSTNTHTCSPRLAHQRRRWLQDPRHVRPKGRCPTVPRLRGLGGSKRAQRSDAASSRIRAWAKPPPPRFTCPGLDTTSGQTGCLPSSAATQTHLRPVVSLTHQSRGTCAAPSVRGAFAVVSEYRRHEMRIRVSTRHPWR